MTTAQLRSLLTKCGTPFGSSDSQEAELAAKVEAAGATGLTALMEILLPNGGYSIARPRSSLRDPSCPRSSRGGGLATKRAIQLQAHARRIRRPSSTWPPRRQSRASRHAHVGARRAAFAMRRENAAQMKASTTIQSYARMKPKRRRCARCARRPW